MYLLFFRTRPLNFFTLKFKLNRNDGILIGGQGFALLMVMGCFAENDLNWLSNQFGSIQTNQWIWGAFPQSIKINALILASAQRSINRNFEIFKDQSIPFFVFEKIKQNQFRSKISGGWFNRFQTLKPWKILHQTL